MLHEVSFKSFNERDTVYGWIYVPACEPKGIVQLIHGFGEHSRRYFHLIVRLMEAGYIVAADDHVGHGQDCARKQHLGRLGQSGFPYNDGGRAPAQSACQRALSKPSVLPLRSQAWAP